MNQKICPNANVIVSELILIAAFVLLLLVLSIAFWWFYKPTETLAPSIDSQFWQQAKSYQEQKKHAIDFPEGQIPFGEHFWMRYRNSRPAFPEVWRGRFQHIGLASTDTGKLALIAQGIALNPPELVSYYLTYLEAAIRLRQKQLDITQVNTLLNRLETYHTVLDNDLAYADIYFLKAKLATLQGQYQQATSFARQATEIDPFFFYAYDLYWQSYYRQLPWQTLKDSQTCLSETENLLKIISRMVKLTDDPLIFYKLAQTAEKLSYQPIKSLIIAYFYLLGGEKEQTLRYLTIASKNPDLDTLCRIAFEEAIQNML